MDEKAADSVAKTDATPTCPTPEVPGPLLQEYLSAATRPGNEPKLYRRGTDSIFHDDAYTVNAGEDKGFLVFVKNNADPKNADAVTYLAGNGSKNYGQMEWYENQQRTDVDFHKEDPRTGHALVVKAHLKEDSGKPYVDNELISAIKDANPIIPNERYHFMNPVFDGYRYAKFDTNGKRLEFSMGPKEDSLKKADCSE